VAKATFIALLLLLITAPVTRAAVAEVGGATTQKPPGFNKFVVFHADPGEANRVTAVADGKGERIRDDGAELHAGAGCDPISPHEVFCHAKGLSADLGDGNDSLTAQNGSVSGGTGNDILHVGGVLRGGPGDDVLVGRAESDDIDGGGGQDILNGGGGNDDLTDGDDATTGVGPDRIDGGRGIDQAAYAQRGGPLVVDLRRPGGQGGLGEDDTLTSIERVVDSLGPHPTTATGDGGPNELNLFADRSIARGMGGNDFLIAWSDRRDVLSGGAGNDLLEPSGDAGSEPDALSCGPGRDEVDLSDAPAQLVPDDCEWVVDADDASLRYRLLGPLRGLDAPVVRVTYGNCDTEAGDCRVIWALREEVGRGPRSAGPLLARRAQRDRRSHRGGPLALRLTPAGRALVARRRSVRARLGFLLGNRVTGGFVIRIQVCQTLTRSC